MSYSHHIYQEKMLAEVKDETKREMLRKKLDNEKIIRQHMAEQKRNRTRNSELQETIIELSKWNNKAKELLGSVKLRSL